jgi:ATP-dependent Clp protease ATP-binding subunit ClpC
MDARFSDRGRNVMELAQLEARRFKHEYVGTEHILLGLLKAGRGVAVEALENLKVDPDKIVFDVERIVQLGSDTVTNDRLPQTPRARKVIEYAIDEARKLNHDYIGSEHLLLGLLREDEGVASQILMNRGLRLETLRDETLKLRQRGK